MSRQRGIGREFTYHKGLELRTSYNAYSTAKGTLNSRMIAMFLATPGPS